MNEFTAVQPAPRAGARFRHIFILLLLAFAAGGVATWWLADKYGYFDEKIDTAALTAQPSRPDSSLIAPVLPPAETVASIESRMTQINADAAAASGNAARAEGLMIAFAARRAIDSGAPLGYLAEQLRVRFGASQPQSVSTIVMAAQAPVTLETLRSELAVLGPSLVSGSREDGIGSRLRREFSEMFVLRKDGSASTAPTQRLQRAQTLVDAGRIGEAITEISAMPGAKLAQDWLTKARRYVLAHQALDLLEQGALAAPAPPVTVTAAPASRSEAQNAIAPE